MKNIKDNVIEVVKSNVYTIKNPKKINVLHSASFVLAVGGIGLILSSLFKKDKAQKLSLKTAEAGFLFDNFGVSKFGLDKMATAKPTGSSFLVGGLTCATSQFMGIDTKEGRATQWLGIGFAFLGWTLERANILKDIIKNNKKL